MATHAQAAVLEGCELEGARAHQHAARQHPRVPGQPGMAVHHPVDEHVADERHVAEHRPDQCVAADERGESRAGVRLSAPRANKQPQQRQRRGQHHRRQHRLPGDQEQRHRGPARQRSLDQRVVVQRTGPAPRLRCHGQHPSADDGRRHDDRQSPTAHRRGCRAHPAKCSFQSDWMAFRSDASHSRSNWGSDTFWLSALATYAGEPGTVEKAELFSVVVVPSGPV